MCWGYSKDLPTYFTEQCTCFQALKGMTIAHTAMCPLAEELTTTMKKQPRIGSNHPKATKICQQSSSKHQKVFTKKQQASTSLQALSTSIHKPLESNSKQPKSLQGSPFLGFPKIDHFPIVCSNRLRSARSADTTSMDKFQTQISDTNLRPECRAKKQAA